MNHWQKFCWSAVFTAFGLLASEQAYAVSLAIANAGFEDPVLAPQAFTNDSLPDWALHDPSGVVVGGGSGQYGALNPSPSVGTAGYGAGGAAEGNNVAYLFNGPNDVGMGGTEAPFGIEQTLGDVLTANTKYTLQVEVGNEQGFGAFNTLAGFPGYRVELLAGVNVIAMEDSLVIADGTFGTSMLMHTANAGDPFLGQSLGIRLLSLGAVDGRQVDFDDVRLDATIVVDPGPGPGGGNGAVPEPITATLGLMGLGVLGMATRRRAA